MCDWELLTSGPNIHQINVNYSSVEETFWVLLLADLHWDNPKCNRTLLKRHMDQAKKVNAPIISVGDLFCAMQGKYDKRSSKDDLRPEHQNVQYLDSLVDTAIEWFDPYKKHLCVLGQGNHETSILNHHETNLLDRLAAGLRKNGGITQAGGYSGWLKLNFLRAGKSKNSCKIWYHHGFGGGGPVTQGKIDFNRYGMYVDADVFVAGHVHYKESFPYKRVRLSNKNVPRSETMWMLRCSTYKDEFKKGEGGFHVEKGRGPRPLGGYWLECRAIGDGSVGWTPIPTDGD